MTGVDVDQYSTCMAADDVEGFKFRATACKCKSDVEIESPLHCQGTGSTAEHDAQRHDPSEDRLALPTGDEDAARVSRLYPNSFQTADVKHVVDNLLHECLDSMTTCLNCTGYLDLELGSQLVA